jgi:hypothetical protein
MASSKPERRRYTRVNFNAEVTLTQNKRSFVSNLVDVSLNGILLDTPKDYEIRTDLPVEARIQLTDDTIIQMSARLVHSSSEVLGFKCESIDVDSIGHLRRLVELNIDAPNAAERVLNELVSP